MEASRFEDLPEEKQQFHEQAGAYLLEHQGYEGPEVAAYLALREADIQARVRERHAARWQISFALSDGPRSPSEVLEV
jgi:hypothetical protein